MAVVVGLANPVVSARNRQLPAISGFPLNPSVRSPVHFSSKALSVCPLLLRKENLATYRSRVRVRANYSGNGGRPSSGSLFGGFVLGGIIIGTLGCVFAPQLSKALAAADKKVLMRKPPNFIYDEEKALEEIAKGRMTLSRSQRTSLFLMGGVIMSPGTNSWPANALAQQYDAPAEIPTLLVSAIPETSYASAASSHLQRLLLLDLDPAIAKLASGIMGPFFSAFGFLFILRIIMSWYPKLPVGKFPYVLAYAPTEPLLKVTRKLIPPVGGVDVTPVVWFGLVSFLNEILVGRQGLLVLLSQQQV